MKKIKILFSSLFLSAIFMLNINSFGVQPIGNGLIDVNKCDSGGEGATSCSIKDSVMGLSSECSVTVGNGYYACCSQTFNGARCTAEKS
jgi:hypothetical protein